MLKFSSMNISVQFSCSVVSNSLRPHGLHHNRLPWPSLTPRACSNSSPLNRGYYPILSHSLYRPLLLLPSNFLSIIVFPNDSAHHIRGPKYWSFSFSISPSNEYSGLIFFMIDWFDLAVEGTLKSLLQHHSSKASILQCSAFLTIQLSDPYMTTKKAIVFTRWNFVSKIMSLLFKMLSRLVITFLLRRKHPRMFRYLLSLLLYKI